MATSSNPGLRSFVKHFRYATVLALFWVTIFTGMILANPADNPEKSGNHQAINDSNYQLENRETPAVSDDKHPQKPDLKTPKMAAKVTAEAPGFYSDGLNLEKSQTETELPASYSSFNYDWLNFGYFNYLLNMTSGGVNHLPLIQRPKRKVPYQSVGFVRWTRNTMMANIPEPMKRIIFPRCPFFPCPDNHACDLSTNSCRLLLHPEYE